MQLRTNTLLICLAVSALIVPSGIASSNSCTLPLTPADVSHPNFVIGNGSPASCTEQALSDALNTGGIITFNCGSSPVTISITTEHAFRNDMNTVLDGKNLVTLQGNGSTRLFGARSGAAPWYGGTAPWWKSTLTSVTLQNLTISGGRSSGPSLPALPAGASSTCSQGTELTGGGGAIFVRDMVLHVINSRFTNNHGPSLGPDVAGGAIYAMGSIDVTIQNTTFDSNDAANGGAVGMLITNYTDVDNTYTANRALGHDGNHNVQSSGCPIHDNQYQIGSGGDAGALYLDGQATPRGTIVCGTRFANNVAGSNAEGGAIFGGGDPEPQSIIVNQSEFDNNQSNKGGAAYSYVGQLFFILSSFINNHAAVGGAIQTDNSTLLAVNDTFANNSASTAIGAVATFSGTSAAFVNSTFSGNSAPYFPIAFPGDTGIAIPNLIFNNNIFTNNTATGYPLKCYTTFPGSNNVLWPFAAGAVPQGACAAGTLMINPQLSAPADNGGGVQTMAMPAGNAAATVGTNCPPTDERGAPRGAVCAAGAFQP